MRISDWSSDVCSSDLLDLLEFPADRADRCRRDECAPVRRHASRQGANPVAGASAQIGDVWTFGLDSRILLSRRSYQGLRYAARPSRPERHLGRTRSEEHTSELQSLMRISYAVFCLKKKIDKKKH